MASRPTRKKRPAAAARAFKRRKVSFACSDDDEGAEGESSVNSQQEELGELEEMLAAVRKKKRSSSESPLAAFSKRVAAEGESLATKLRKERLEKKAEAGAFSEQLGVLISRALNNAPIHSHPLRVYEEKVFELSTGLLRSAGSLRSMLSETLDRELDIGKGWEKDGDDAIEMLLQDHRSSRARVLATISDDTKRVGNEGNGFGNEGSEVEGRMWRNRSRRAAKVVGKLVNSLQLPIPETAAQNGILRKKGGWGRG